MLSQQHKVLGNGGNSKLHNCGRRDRLNYYRRFPPYEYVELGRFVLSATCPGT